MVSGDVRLAFTKKIHEREIRDIFQYWLERRPPNGVPDRGSIDPRTIPYKYLPSLFLYEAEPEGRFRCKLIGTDITRILGKDETGQYLDETLDLAVAKERSKLFKQAVASGRPVYYRYLALTARGDQRLFARILLPVSSAGGKANQIFGMMRYGPVENRSGRLKSAARENSLLDVVAATDDDLANLAASSAAR